VASPFLPCHTCLLFCITSHIPPYGIVAWASWPSPTFSTRHPGVFYTHGGCRAAGLRVTKPPSTREGGIIVAHRPSQRPRPQRMAKLRVMTLAACAAQERGSRRAFAKVQQRGGVLAAAVGRPSKVHRFCRKGVPVIAGLPACAKAAARIVRAPAQVHLWKAVRGAPVAHRGPSEGCEATHPHARRPADARACGCVPCVQGPKRARDKDLQKVSVSADGVHSLLVQLPRLLSASKADEKGGESEGTQEARCIAGQATSAGRRRLQRETASRFSSRRRRQPPDGMCAAPTRARVRLRADVQNTAGQGLRIPRSHLVRPLPWDPWGLPMLARQHRPLGSQHVMVGPDSEG
jgi:hypothetical protein